MRQRIAITEDNFDDEYKLVEAALQDFLLMYFEIGADCLPYGDFSRAPLGEVDPFRFLDISYTSPAYGFIDERSLRMLHQGAAVNLLCRLADFHENAMGSFDGHGYSSAFKAMLSGDTEWEQWRNKALDLLKIYDAFVEVRIIDIPAIRGAFSLAFSDPGAFLAEALPEVYAEVIAPCVGHPL